MTQGSVLDKRVFLRVEVPVYNRLKEIALREGCGMSDIVREAVGDWLAEYDEEGEG